MLSNVGSFVNLRGGHLYPERVLAGARKPIRVYLCDGRNDNRGLRDGAYDERRDRFLQNVRLMRARLIPQEQSIQAAATHPLVL